MTAITTKSKWIGLFNFYIRKNKKTRSFAITYHYNHSYKQGITLYGIFMAKNDGIRILVSPRKLHIHIELFGQGVILESFDNREIDNRH